jgi:hypothetical protein
VCRVINLHYCRRRHHRLITNHDNSEVFLLNELVIMCKTNKVTETYSGVFDGYEAIASGFPKSLHIAIEDDNWEVVNTVIGILMD